MDDKEEVVLKLPHCPSFCINAQSSLLKSVVLFEEKLLHNTKNRECFIYFNQDLSLWDDEMMFLDTDQVCRS